jgi:hypothetical protein
MPWPVFLGTVTERLKSKARILRRYLRYLLKPSQEAISAQSWLSPPGAGKETGC